MIVITNNKGDCQVGCVPNSYLQMGQRLLFSATQVAQEGHSRLLYSLSGSIFKKNLRRISARRNVVLVAKVVAVVAFELNQELIRADHALLMGDFDEEIGVVLET